MIITAPCIQCKRILELHVPESEWAAYKKGGLIQYSLTSLTSSERELLISGYCSECFDEIFADDEEDEEIYP